MRPFWGSQHAAGDRQIVQDVAKRLILLHRGWPGPPRDESNRSYTLKATPATNCTISQLLRRQVPHRVMRCYAELGVVLEVVREDREVVTFCDRADRQIRKSHRVPSASCSIR